MSRLLAVLVVLLAGTAGAADLMDRDLAGNPAPYIPPQCWTETEDAAGRAHNPCYACHIPTDAPNYLNDGDLQLAYTFPGPMEVNPWSNLFRDHGAALAGQSDAEILDYVRQSNYFGPEGDLILARRLADLPAGWDYDGDGRWDGYVPDAWFRFDDEGFDIAPDGSPTGWRAFAYYPFLGTFWPTNGSTDDVLIRLAPAFRTTDGAPDRETYKVNLAIVEAMIRRADVPIAPVDESRWGVDLDRNGRLGTADTVVYDWAPLEGRFMSYVGDARQAQQDGKVHLAAGLFPEGTEFLHSVRYIDVVDGADPIALAPRLKELRYARKRLWQTYADLEEAAMAEIKEKDAFPDRLRMIHGNAEQGVANGQGWVYQGFIEDAAGDLRPQTYAETVFCVGCHSGIGATTDSAFAFPRRLGADAFQAGWYHWSQRGLKGLADPVRADGHREYAYYLEQNGAGDEFRANQEVMDRFFTAEGALKPDMLAELADDITVLLYPSRQRALALNKAYRTIVRDQSFARGRDAILAPVTNVHREVDEDQPTGITEIVPGPGDLRPGG